ncbi:hypothetical protein R3P38DRAFT_2922272 [Favolaschia claudopus]|uniref:Uncharacterized protein n=1 Tax=Favolaschia claudopus TaxID=2862362 RepID=A0AAW0C3F2_9AGAR
MAESASSTTTTFLVKPSGPTLLDGVSELPIDGLDVFGYNAANSYIIPELVDVKRFSAALGKAVRWFPLYAARVRCADGGGVPWVLTLPPQGIPVTLSSSPSTTIVPIEAIVQKPLRFLPPLNPREITRDPTTPLASILLTHFPNLGKTSIGITRWHPIGSDYVASRFIRLLSALYVASAIENFDRDADALLEDEPKPVYAAARTYLPAPNAESLEGIDTSALESYYRIGTTHPQLDASVPANVRLDFRLSNAQMQALRSAIRTGPEQDIKLSAQDCLVALVAAATNAADPGTPPIHTISTILDVRGAAGVPSELSFNGFTFAPTDRVVVEVGKGQQETYLAYASAVRRSIVKARDPGFLSALVDLQARRAEEATTHGEVMDLASGEGHMLVNSTLRLDALMRPHIHFGHPGKTRSYVGTVPFVRHLKLARPNPSSTNSPTTRLDAVEVTLYFQPHVRERFKEELTDRLRSLAVLVEGAVEWVEENVESSEQN